MNMTKKLYELPRGSKLYGYVNEKTKAALHDLLDAVCSPTVERSIRIKAKKWFDGSTMRLGQ